MVINSVGELIRAARNGRSPKDFAQLLDVKQSSVSRYESGKASPPIYVIDHCMRLVLRQVLTMPPRPSS
jgi:LysR family nitrogen assimilation transcriptional regulator